MNEIFIEQFYQRQKYYLTRPDTTSSKTKVLSNTTKEDLDRKDDFSVIIPMQSS